MESAIPITATEHSARRRRLISRSARWNAAARIVSIAAGLAQVPIALKYLQPEAFGLWMALAGIVQLLAFADMGLGLGLQNKISEAFGKDDSQSIADLYRTGQGILALFGVILAALMLPLCWLLPWGGLFKVTDAALRSQIPAALAVLTLAFALGMPLNAASRLATGVQQGWMLGAGAAAGSMIALVLVRYASWMELPFAAFVATIAISPVLANIGIMVAIAGRGRSSVLSSKGRFRSSLVRPLWTQGVLFLLPQIGSTVMTAAPAVTIGTVVGTPAVTAFSLCQRLSGLILQFQTMPVNALWPAYAEARSRRDFNWIKITFRKSMIYGLASGAVIGILFGTGGGWLIRIWTNLPGKSIDTALLWMFAVWTATVAIVTPVGVFLNGCGRLRGQAVGGVLSATALLLLLSPLTVIFGPAGAVASMLGACVLAGWPFVIADCRRVWKTL